MTIADWRERQSGVSAVRLVGLVAALASAVAGGCASHGIIDCAGPGVNVDMRDLGARFAKSGRVTACADRKCVTFPPGPSGETQLYPFVPLHALGVPPKAISVRITEDGRTVFSAATHEQFSAHRGGKCSNGLFYVRVDASGQFHPSP
jgi:hypothetical protein